MSSDFCFVLAQVVLQPIEFVYSAALIKRVSSFFSFLASDEVLNDQVLNGKLLHNNAASG